MLIVLLDFYNSHRQTKSEKVVSGLIVYKIALEISQTVLIIIIRWNIYMQLNSCNMKSHIAPRWPKKKTFPPYSLRITTKRRARFPGNVLVSLRQRRIWNTCPTSKMDRFAKIVNSIQQLTILAKHSVLDVWQVSEYASVHIMCESKRTIKKYRKEKPRSSGLRISVA